MQGNLRKNDTGWIFYSSENVIARCVFVHTKTNLPFLQKGKKTAELVFIFSIERKKLSLNSEQEQAFTV